MSSLPRLVIAAVGLAALAMATAGCSSSGGEPAADDGKISVVASTNVWGSVVQAVGGDAVAVKSIIADPSADPHSYEDKPENATALTGAKLAIYNGGGYDDFFTRLVDSAGKDARKIVAFDVSGKADAGGGEVNEHVWYDLPTVTKVAEKVAEELGAIAPDKKDTFTGNLEAFNNQIGELVNKLVDAGGGQPGAKVLATEPIAVYLFETAGLTDATPEDFAEAIEEETDPSPAAVAETTELVTGKQVSVLVNNAQTETPVTRSLREAATAAGVPVVDVTETLPEGVTSYVDWMTKQVDALAGALART
jgi:zinc/manganese transport system substrate-binding protein